MENLDWLILNLFERNELGVQIIHTKLEGKVENELLIEVYKFFGFTA